MRLPNKITSYKESIVFKMLILLKKLSLKSYTVVDLYNEVCNDITISDYQDALVALYAFGKIKLVGEVIYYVERNLL